MTDKDIMLFGKYRGTVMEEVPAAYLLTLEVSLDRYKVAKAKKAVILQYIKENRTVLHKQIEQPIEDVEEEDKDIDFDFDIFNQDV